MLRFCDHRVLVLLVITLYGNTATDFLTKQYIECGPYGFICEGSTKIRLCEGRNLFGPVFNCPSNTICNDESNAVCDNAINYIDPALRKVFRCNRNERIGDPSVPGCKGYIMCIPNKNRFQGIKFKCAGDTIFNGITRTCTSAERYKCPLNTYSTTTPNLYLGQNDRMDTNKPSSSPDHRNRPIDCKNYNFVVTQDNRTVRAKYFCPALPVNGEPSVRCTIFSNQFCITLERDDQDQFVDGVGAAYRRPRTHSS